MARNGSDTLQGVLTGYFDHHFVADLYYDGARRLQGVPITEPKFSEDGDASIQQSGSVTVQWSDEFATSISPTAVTDPLAPYGAQLWVYCVVEAGPFSERVEFGRFEIVNVPTAVDQQIQFRGEWITTGSQVELELKELLAGPARESFDVPTAPTGLTSTWDEVGRIAGLSLRRTVPDAPINRSAVYPDSKLDAIYELMDVMLDAVPHMTADGTLAARPNAWPGVSREIRLGSIEKVGNLMSADQVSNRVVVRAVGGDQSTILAVAEITSGPLRVANADGSVSPFRRRTKYLSSEFVTTHAKALRWAQSTLAQVSDTRTRVLPVTMTFDPLIERGDVILIERPDVWLTARVVTIDRSGHATQDLMVEVGETTPKSDASADDLFADLFALFF